jgi:hypothetical protein
MSHEFPERDWKWLRQLKPQLLARFCERVLDNAVSIVNDSTVGSHERYLKLYEYTREQDRVLGAAFDGQRRSNGLSKIAAIHAQGLFTDEEFAQFTEETREMIAPSLSRVARRRQRTAQEVQL